MLFNGRPKPILGCGASSFQIYICGIKFLIGFAINLVSGIATKAALVLPIVSFTNCCGNNFMLIFC